MEGRCVLRWAGRTTQSTKGHSFYCYVLGRPTQTATRLSHPAFGERLSEAEKCRAALQMAGCSGHLS